MTPEATEFSLTRLLKEHQMLWEGNFVLKETDVPVEMFYLRGNQDIATASLPVKLNDKTPAMFIKERTKINCLDITHRLHLILRNPDQHCMLLALPYGQNNSKVLKKHHGNIQEHIINYLKANDSVGIIKLGGADPDKINYVIHIFPKCSFTDYYFKPLAPLLFASVADLSYLFIVIVRT